MKFFFMYIKIYFKKICRFLDGFDNSIIKNNLKIAIEIKAAI